MKKFLLAAIVVSLALTGATTFAQSSNEPVANLTEPKLTATEETEARELITRYWRAPSRDQ